MRPSTPAVLRPALTSVTRRTLTSALLRERSISFCRLRTFFRSPARDAAKIRCRSRRTFSSAWPQSTWSQSGRPSSGPFTGTGADAIASVVPFTVSNLPFGSGVAACFPPQAHQTRVSALSGRDISPYPAGYAGTAGGGASSRSRFPGAFRPPAFASRVILRPLGSCAFLTSGLPAGSARRTPSGLSRSAWPRCGRGGCRLNPGDGGALPTGRWTPAGTCRLPAAVPFLPPAHSACGSPPNGASSAIHSRSPVRPSPACDPRTERGSLGISPGSAPRGYPQRTPGRGRSLHTGPGTTSPT